MSVRLILAINPGSTSTKFAVFGEEALFFEKTLNHSLQELSGFDKITDQFHFRKDLILNELINRKTELSEIKAVVGRGGLVKPIESGVYEVNERMIQDLKKGVLGQHASNLGGLIANDIAGTLPVKPFEYFALHRLRTESKVLPGTGFKGCH